MDDVPFENEILLEHAKAARQAIAGDYSLIIVGNVSGEIPVNYQAFSQFSPDTSTAEEMGCLLMGLQMLLQSLYEEIHPGKFECIKICFEGEEIKYNFRDRGHSVHIYERDNND